MATRNPRSARRRPPAHEAPPRRDAVAPGLWIYGRHPAEAAAANPRRRCLQLLAVREAAAPLTAATERSGASRPPVEIVERRRLDAVVGEDAVHQGVAVRAEPLPAIGLDAAVAAAAPPARILVLDQVTDPRNVGAILRAAAAFAAAAVVVQDRHAPPETGALAKAASGALETVPLIRVVNVARALRALRDAGIHVVGLAGDADTALPGADLRGPLALVLGSEGSGLRRLVRESCETLARIPIGAGVDSLNVATAAAIALYAAAAAQGSG